MLRHGVPIYSTRVLDDMLRVPMQGPLFAESRIGLASAHKPRGHGAHSSSVIHLVAQRISLHIDRTFEPLHQGLSWTVRVLQRHPLVVHNIFIAQQAT